MRTLTAGSFLNLENNETVEALKNTARRLAEHTGTVVEENLNSAALENLADSLWQKAEYVTRETERRRLRQIFNENFRERFRELKPEAAEARNSDVEVSPADSTFKIADSDGESNASAIVERETSETTAATGAEVSSTVSPKNSATVAEGKKDEFLGFVASGESFGDDQTAETEAEALTALEESPQTIAQAEDEPAVETSQTEVRTADVETVDSANQVADVGNSKQPETAENSNDAKTETTTVAAATPIAASKPAAATPTTNEATASAGKNGAGAQEPFEFEKCTINLNLTLLPMESGSNKRKVIVGAMSHNLPPEIDFLEVADGADLTQLADLLREKLARFKQTLPVKYIEQLRSAKNKSAKKPAAKPITATAAISQPASKQTTVEKTSGGQKTLEASNARTDKPQSQAATAEESNVTASNAPTPAFNQSVAANNIQGSLF